MRDTFIKLVINIKIKTNRLTPPRCSIIMIYNACDPTTAQDECAASRYERRICSGGYTLADKDGTPEG